MVAICGRLSLRETKYKIFREWVRVQNQIRLAQALRNTEEARPTTTVQDDLPANPNRKSSIGDRQFLPSRLSEEMFEENSAGDGVVKRVVGFAARAEFANAGFKFQSGDQIFEFV